MASKRKIPSISENKTLKDKVDNDQDEAIGEDLELDKSSEDESSDDDESSDISDLEGEHDDDNDEEEEESSEDDDSSSDDERDNPIDIPINDNEYENDSSDEEDLRNTIGNVPTNWYDEYDHIGYDVSGKKIIKPKRGDELENFLSRMENPEHGVTVVDSQTGQVNINECEWLIQVIAYF